jgi:REP element-mobilizing transposase RayT
MGPYHRAMKYKSNNNVVYPCKYHVVFRLKYRRRVPVDVVDERLKVIVRQVVADTRCELIEMEVLPDHVPPLVEVDPQSAIRRFLKMAKNVSAMPALRRVRRFRMRPTPAQEPELLHPAGARRWVWNRALARRRACFAEYGRSIPAGQLG